jgi:hypothetical protein
LHRLSREACGEARRRERRRVVQPLRYARSGRLCGKRSAKNLLLQKTCIIPTYAPVCDSPTFGLVGELESRGVANTEKLPFLLLST